MCWPASMDHALNPVVVLCTTSLKLEAVGSILLWIASLLSNIQISADLYSDVSAEAQTHRSLSSVTLCYNHESAEMHVTNCKALLNFINIVCRHPCRNVGMQ